MKISLFPQACEEKKKVTSFMDLAYSPKINVIMQHGECNLFSKVYFLLGKSGPFILQ